MQRLVRFTAVFVLVLTTCLFAAGAASAAPAQAGATENYLVLYKGNNVPADAGGTIAEAGGTLVYTYDAIGVAVAQSNSVNFRANLLKDNRVEGASATTGFGTQLVDTEEDAAVSQDIVFPPGFSYRWDMTQIYVDQAHAVTMGSPDVIVGDIDTGLDWKHPALAPNVDFSRSVSCVGGVPNQDPNAWMDDHGHGTHTAGTIAARPFQYVRAGTTYNIVGVAPNVKIAGIKASTKDGYFYPEAVVCSFVWAADHGIAVTNNSYYADPWLFNCRNDANQHAIWKAEQRAIRYAMSKGVVVVAAMGNESMDLSKQNVDATSPDDGTIVTRDVTNACVQVPVEVSGVIGVTALTSTRAKAGYSNYGAGVADVAAPGSSIWSTRRGGGATSMSGTSMASPHVAGVAALIISQYGHIPPGAVEALLQNTADNLPCPADTPACQGGAGFNGFFGHGEVNAFNAVTAKR
jgi:hypothetical protein